MQSFLIISQNNKSGTDYAYQLCKDMSINNFDITTLERSEDKESKQTIGIAEIRNFQSKIFLKPLKGKKKAVIINNAETLTTEAQNALLKVLEEPPLNTIIILTAENKNSLLPTILSRCQIIEIKETLKEKSEENLSEYQSFLASLQSKGVGERLKISQDNSKTKEDATKFIEKVILAIREQLINKLTNEPDNQTFNYQLSTLNFQLSTLQKTYTIIKTTNVSPRLALEKLLIEI